MKILVLLKETFATDFKVVLTPAGKIDDTQVSYIVNPYDEYALEEAVKIKEDMGGEVILYTVGRKDGAATLKNALAMGADRAMLITAGAKDSQTVTELLAETIKQKDPDFDLILAGWIAIDDNNAQVPGRLSTLLGLPLVNVVTKLNINIKQRKILCEREADGVQEIVEVELPAVIAVQKGINVPRYPTVQNILQARKKKIQIIFPEVENKHDSVITYQIPRKRKAALLFDNSDPQQAVFQLVQKLQEDKVL
ncbi:MAG: electron transfer flavoprotein subunit beta/FixA family protein [Bacillota bacterium]|uniref:Electron transfer flavoprotein subunit beta n=1 Tax=Thermanaerosceptrum fracticalcis TaxID=1712410 RepID=A0A7G6E789_THEFR|nr:electron transfer flavoprotein subunit beta/FixA family protein [Thermanaerosceptrum fracticalcis]QNB47943.1 electron transfer flavoprotein subunit beta [Thermanaerosceptrum fracticalcis]